MGASGAPTSCWVRTWLLTAAFFGGSIGALEARLRFQGYQPGVPDSAELWAYHRSRVKGSDPKLIVAIGTSRIRADIRPDVLGKCLPGREFVQLGVTGPRSSVGLLLQLAAIPGFCGTILCDALPPLWDKSRWNDLATYYTTSIGRFAISDTYFHCLLCDYFVATNPLLTLRRYVAGVEARPPREREQYLRVHLDRSLDVDYLTDQALVRMREEGRQEYADQYREAGKDLNLKMLEREWLPFVEAVRRIRSNGGRVIFVRFPSSGGRLELEESAFPSATYFNALVQATGSEWIDFRELGDRGAFECPDESHLSARAGAAFTKSLLARIFQ